MGREGLEPSTSGFQFISMPDIHNRLQSCALPTKLPSRKDIQLGKPFSKDALPPRQRI